MTMKTWLAPLLVLVVGLLAAAAQTASRDAMIARAKSLELKTAYVPVPGDPLEHPCVGFRTRDVFGGVHYRAGSGVRRGERWLFCGTSC